jgi:ubiquinone/menaquinone biosynthesis C-methylase UbiE
MNTAGSARLALMKQNLSGMFGRLAPTYDRVGPRFFSQFGRRLVELARLQKGARVLDVATGKGAILFPAAEAVGPHGHVTGVDLSQAMIDELAQEVSREGLGNIDLQLMDAEHLEFPDASFDQVFCGFAIFFFPDLDRALSEMHRILKPGGRIAVSSWDRAFHEQWRWFDDLVLAFLPAEPHDEPVSDSFPPRLLDRPKGVREVLEKVGFANVQAASEAFEFVYPDVDLWWSAAWTHGARASLEKIEKAGGPQALEKFRAAVFQQRLSISQPDGIHERFTAVFALATKPLA